MREVLVISKIRTRRAIGLAFCAAGYVLLAACRPAEESHAKAILGAVLIDGTGGPPISDSAVIVAGDRIRAAGARVNTAIPQGADRIDARGKFVAPAVIEVAPGSAKDVVWLAPAEPDAARAALEQARSRGERVIAEARSLADARVLVRNGATALVDRIPEEIDAEFLNDLRNLRTIVIPTSARHCPELIASGVRVAGGAGGVDLLASAGVPPTEALPAVTRNAAAALGLQRGSVEPGKRADLLVLTANPMEDIRNLLRPERRMIAGEWQ